MEEFKEGKFTVVVEPDPEAESGRDCDNIGVMICFHKRHDLGDKHSSTPQYMQGNGHIKHSLESQDMLRPTKSSA